MNRLERSSNLVKSVVNNSPISNNCLQRSVFRYHQQNVVNRKLENFINRIK